MLGQCGQFANIARGRKQYRCGLIHDFVDQDEYFQSVEEKSV